MGRLDLRTVVRPDAGPTIVETIRCSACGAVWTGERPAETLGIRCPCGVIAFSRKGHLLRMIHGSRRN